MSKETETLLRESLKTAVPLWIEELKEEPFDEISIRAQVCAHVIAEKGDIILYKSNKSGESAYAFNRPRGGDSLSRFCAGRRYRFRITFRGGA